MPALMIIGAVAFFVIANVFIGPSSLETSGFLF